MTISNTISDDSFGFRPPVYAGIDPKSVEVPPADVRVVTSGGLTIPAHSSVMASVSRVLEKMIDRPREHRSSHKIVPILGVPCQAVVAFLRFLYSSRCMEEELEKYGIHLLTLSHVYSVPQLKRKCAKELVVQLTMDNVVDVLQLARLCDAPDLYLKCLKLVSKDFKAVETTEGWRFMQDHDPWLELEILKFLDETETREKKRRKRREEENLYVELCEAMDCLQHICTEGCTSVGPYDKEPTKDKSPCSKFSTCQGLQSLIRHFATCTKRVNGRCIRCVRMWQLLKLHSSICTDQSDKCRVPLCSCLELVEVLFHEVSTKAPQQERESDKAIESSLKAKFVVRQFKLRAQPDGKGKADDARWRLLVRKVVCAKVMSSLTFPVRNLKRQSTCYRL